MDTPSPPSFRTDAGAGQFELVAALAHAVDLGASDIHLKAGNHPLMRLHGALVPLSDAVEPLTPRETEQILHMVATASKIEKFESTHELDLAYTAPGVGRFRVNAYQQRGSIALVFRAVPRHIRTVKQLGLPDVLLRLGEEENGIVLVTGTTSSGKSTTMAAVIEHVNQTMCKHIVAIEDPIEFIHHDAMSSVDQREVGTDTESFKGALRQVLRQDPDIIFIGEMRDEETVRTALSAADTGHLVLATLHTVDAPETIGRIVDFFPGREQQQARVQLADTLKGIVSQRLVPSVDRKSRTPITEVMLMTGRVHDMIIDSTQTGRLTDVIAEGSYYGMHTFDQALCELVLAGTVTIEDALRHATRPTDLELLVRAGGQSHPSMDDLPPPPQAVVGTHPDELANDKGNPTNPEQARRDAVAFRQ
ncbi:MAG: PilT/PilU family type 4a pilus ATPase [Solirubrobacteraceae bacterium]